MLVDDKIQLRPFEPGDADAVHAYLNRPQLMGRRYLPDEFPSDAPLSTAQVEKLLQRWTNAERGQTTLAVTHPETKALVGHAILGAGWDAHSGWVAVTIHPAHWRKGYGGAALHLLLAYLFKQTVAHAAATGVAEWNEEGLGFIRAHGFKAAGRMRRVDVHQGAYCDELMFDMLRPEWQALHGEGA